MMSVKLIDGDLRSMDSRPSDKDQRFGRIESVRIALYSIETLS